VVLRELTEDEKEARLRALTDAKFAEEEARKRAEEEATRRAVEEDRVRREREAAEKRKAEEEARKAAEEDARRRAELEATRRLEKKETETTAAPAQAPPAISPRKKKSHPERRARRPRRRLRRVRRRRAAGVPASSPSRAPSRTMKTGCAQSPRSGGSSIEPTGSNRWRRRLVRARS